MKIKILHISKIKAIMGSENHLLTLLSGLDKKRFDAYFCILAEARHLSVLSNYQKRLEQAGITTSVLIIGRYPDVKGLWKLTKYIKKENFHIIHTHLIHADFYGTLAAKLAGVSIIISSRHNDDRFRRYKPLIWLNRFLARWHSKIIVISDWVGKFLQEVEGIPAEKIVRIHYGLGSETITQYANRQYVRQRFRIPENVPVIGTIGRLTAQKGHSYLLQAVQRVKFDFPDVRVLIVGEGELQAELEKQTRELGIEANMIFTGSRGHAETLQLLSGFDFFVFPSLWEGFGLVLLEAMALRKAIVASNVSAIPESVIEGDTGILVDSRNVEQLAKAILKLLHNSQLAHMMGESGYKRLQEEFSVPKMIQSTESVYTNTS